MKFESGLIFAAVSCMARPRASSLGRFAAAIARISATVGFVRVATAAALALADDHRLHRRRRRRRGRTRARPAIAAASRPASSRKVSRLTISPTHRDGHGQHQRPADAGQRDEDDQKAGCPSPRLGPN